MRYIRSLVLTSTILFASDGYAIDIDALRAANAVEALKPAVFAESSRIAGNYDVGLTSSDSAVRNEAARTFRDKLYRFCLKSYDTGEDDEFTTTCSGNYTGGDNYMNGTNTCSTRKNEKFIPSSVYTYCSQLAVDAAIAQTPRFQN